MRSDYCPIGGQPCQSMCVTPCSTKRRHISYACPVCAASMLESNEALLRQALEALEELQYAVVDAAATEDVSLYYRAVVALSAALAEPTCKQSLCWMNC